MTNSTKKSDRIELKGLGASPGIAIHKVINAKPVILEITHRKVSKDRVSYEINQFHKALKNSIQELELVSTQVEESIGEDEALIFKSHRMILQDPTFIQGVTGRIENHLDNVEFALFDAVMEFRDIFESIPGDFGKSKVQDIQDVFNRVMSNLTENEFEFALNEDEGQGVYIGHSFTPSFLANCNEENIEALVMDSGSLTSHVAIIARSLKIPSVVGLKTISMVAKMGQTIIVDGSKGVVILNPTEEDLEIYESRISHLLRKQADLSGEINRIPMTVDGKHLCLNANLELPAEIPSVARNGAEGIGLFRSEFMYFNKSLPDEEQQFEIYKELISTAAPNPVTIRTIDTGGDKLVKNLSLSDEPNPFLGWRSIRVCLDNPWIFTEQLRALLRASVYGNLKIMFPMIAFMEELLEAKAILKSVMEQLTLEGIDFDPDVEIGMMVEVPSVVWMIGEFAKEVDFMSVGTNDLIQFALAVDRSNEKIAKLYQPHHPAILRMIKETCDAAHEEGILVSVCGEMASEPLSLMLMAGLGVDEFSMSPWMIPESKKFIRSMTYIEMREVALECIQKSCAKDINAFLYEKYAKRISGLGISSNFIQNYEEKDSSMVRIDGKVVGLNSLDDSNHSSHDSKE